MPLRPTLLLLLLATTGRPAVAQETIGPEPPLTPEAVEALESFIDREVEQKEIPALSIALVADGRIVWARGFGVADPDRASPATAETVYRVGSVSKLFTDLAVMQLVERGELDLDAPVADLLPEFRPDNPFDVPVTLRHLMSHRAGLVREPPVGHYFDPTDPGLAGTVASLEATRLVLEPGTKTKYSNAGLGVVGLAVERASGEPFAKAIRSGILGPLGMDSSDFERSPRVESKLADAIMWGYDGRTSGAPGFALGYAPAGNLYASMPDLGRFLLAIFDEGRGPGGAILGPETLAQMLEPQFDDDARFGIGFAIEQWEGRTRIGHGGAVYGFATELAALPVEEVGVAVSAARDCADVALIADLALETLLALEAGDPLPDFPGGTEAPPTDLIRSLRGRYAPDDEPGRVVELLDQGDRLLLMPPRGGYLTELRIPEGGDGSALVVDGPLVAHGAAIARDGDALVIGDATFRRLPSDEPPPPAPEEWEGLIGEYGWDHNVLFILEREGTLHALIEWFFLYPLEQVDGDTYAFPPTGLYHDETLAFERDDSGRAVRAVLGGSVVFGRRAIGGEDGSTFRVEPLRPVSELRPEALAASPPDEPGPSREPDLVDLTAIDPSIRLDVRYATANNFLGTPFYSSARALMQRPAAEAVARAHEALEPFGLGLLIHDAYRPWYVTKMFFDATPPASRGFVADPAIGSKHNRGCAVDLTLCDRESGEPIRMVAGYDEFSDRAGPYYLGGTSRQRWHRDLLRRVMEEHDFDVIRNEWWHFDHTDWRSYGLGNQPFEAVAPGPPPGR